jgi:hypothetical protein
LSGGFTDRTRALSALFDGCGFDAPVSANIMQDMWDKWVQLAAGAGMNCMMRGSLGDILTALGGQEAILALYAETRAVAAAAGFPSTPAYVEFTTKMYTTAGSPLKGVYVARHRRALYAVCTEGRLWVDLRLLFTHGGPEILQVVELPEVHAGRGQVRIRVHAATVNPTDIGVRNGTRAEQQKADPPPYVPGIEAAGIVDEVGSGVPDRLKVGDAVMAIVVPKGSHGAYREQIVLDARSVVPAPTGKTILRPAACR